MAFRVYISPSITNAGAGPNGVDLVNYPAYVDLFPSAAWGAIHYGGGDSVILAIDLTPSDHAIMAAQTGILAAPENLDGNLTPGQVTAIRNYLDSILVPSDWVNTTRTVRDVIRGISGVFLFAQRMRGLRRVPFFTALPPDLDRQFNSYPADVRADLQRAAADLQIDVSGLTGASTLRDFLRQAGQRWLQRPIIISGFEI